MRLDQDHTYLFDAVKRHAENQILPFHVPGHKRGAGLPELRSYIGENALAMDLNGMEDVDFVNHPTGVIEKAQELLADAYGAQDAFFLVNGTTAGVQAMILSACPPGSKLILPRNAHISTVGGLILSGAVPVYVQPEYSKELGIAMGVRTEAARQAMVDHPRAAAVFLINPTYYGAASDLSTLVRAAHREGMAVLADEAHGAHMPFHPDFPLTAMEAGADMSALSLHKTGGSLTQSSVLLLKNRSDAGRVRQALNLTATSSASYLLLCSLDLARKQLATRGRELLEETLQLARYGREELNEIEGLYAFGRELVGTPGCFDFDETKLGVNVSRLGLTGFRAEEILRGEYGIQVELSDLYNILALITVGDKKESVDALIGALREIAEKSKLTDTKSRILPPENPELIITPREAFYSEKKPVDLADSVGEIAGEMVMAYPPGIPVIGIGERISQDTVDYIQILKEEKCQLQGSADPRVERIRIVRYGAAGGDT